MSVQTSCPLPPSDAGGNNDIRLPYNPCGCVYSIDVDAQYNANKMQAVVCGSPVGLVDANNTCSVEGERMLHCTALRQPSEISGNLGQCCVSAVNKYSSN